MECSLKVMSNAGQEQIGTTAKKSLQLRLFFRVYLSQIVLFVWLVLLGIAIWQDAKRTTMPPTYDALAYFEKGKNVWKHLTYKTWINPLNVDPSYRPPGTVLMSFPFGYHDDFRGFYFRSVYLPVLCLAIAAYVAGYSTGASTLRRWMLCGLAVFFSSLPFFYHFEYTDYSLQKWAVPVYYWGLVDAFLAGVSALAAAACIRGVREASRAWFTLSFILAGVCIFIKPAGLFTMAIVAGSWFFWAIARLWTKDREVRKLALKQFLIVGAIVSLIYGLILTLCFKSLYLSATNLAYGREAMKILQEDFSLGLSLKTIWLFLAPSLGYLLPVYAVLVVILAVVGCKKIQFRQDVQNWAAFLAMVISALGTLVLGAWFWLHETGITQVRYFIPFAMMAIVFAVPLLLPVLVHYRKFSGLLILFACAQAINLVVLLILPAPSAAWQKWSGVYVSTNSCRAEVAQAEKLLWQCREKKTNNRVYALDTSAPYAAFLSVAAYASIIDPEKTSFEVRFPVTWEDASVVRLHDIVSSDYLLFQPTYNPADRGALLSKTAIHDFYEERSLWQAVLTGLSEQDGIQTVSESSVRLLKITDRVKLLKFLETVQHEHNWPSAFATANPKECWSLQEARNTLFHQPAISGLAYEDKFQIDALRIDRSGGNTTLHIGWRRLAGNDGEDWRLFIHEVDGNGNILSNRDISLRNEDQCPAESPLHHAIVSFPTSSDPHIYGIGVGFYRPTPEGFILLHALSGVRDLENKRVLIAYESVQGKQ